MERKPGHISLLERIKTLFVHRRLPLISTLLGVLTGIPTLWTGWGPSDDLLQRSFILSSSLPEVLTRLYVFLDPRLNHLWMDAGYYPWWTNETARIIFFRPIAAFSLWLDYQFWQDSNWLMHLHSLALYGVLCLAAALLFRRLMGRTLQAGLASVLFALSAAHMGAVVSLAARNLILMTLFGVLALHFHDRWRRDGWRPGLPLALLSLALSLFSAETGLTTCAYLLAYALLLDARPLRSRLLSLSPYILLAGAWLVYYQASGYGALGSGFYLSPWEQPFAFTWAIVERFPFILMGQWVLPDPVVYTVLSVGARLLLWVISLAVLVFIAFLLAPLVRRDRPARFWMLGMLLAVVPVCSVSPASGRHLVFISLGAFGLMGQLIAGRLALPAWVPASRGWRRASLWMCLIFAVLHLGLYPLVGAFVRPALDGYAVAATDIGEGAALAEQDVILVNAPSPSLFLYFPSYREHYGLALPAHLRVLAPGFSAVSLIRVDEHTVILQPENGFLVPPVNLDLDGRSFLPLFHSSYSFQYGDGLFRGSGYPLAVGQRVDLAGLSVEVLSLTEDGRPLAVRATFNQPLDDESLLWLAWDWGVSRYVPFELPAPGMSVRIAGPY
jgi:hypothetical protein